MALKVFPARREYKCSFDSSNFNLFPLAPARVAWEQEKKEAWVSRREGGKQRVSTFLVGSYYGGFGTGQTLQSPLSTNGLFPYSINAPFFLAVQGTKFDSKFALRWRKFIHFVLFAKLR